jgi:hypothetical protein
MDNLFFFTDLFANLHKCDISGCAIVKLLAFFFLTEPELIQGISLFYGNSAHRKVAQNPTQNRSLKDTQKRNSINSFQPQQYHMSVFIISNGSKFCMPIFETNKNFAFLVVP